MALCDWSSDVCSSDLVGIYLSQRESSPLSARRWSRRSFRYEMVLSFTGTRGLATCLPTDFRQALIVESDDRVQQLLRIALDKRYVRSRKSRPLTYVKCFSKGLDIGFVGCVEQFPEAHLIHIDEEWCSRWASSGVLLDSCFARRKSHLPSEECEVLARREHGKGRRLT